MKVSQFELWIADLNPQVGTEPGKKRPVLVVQTNLLNNANHTSTLVCPITTKLNKKSNILRVYLEKGISNISKDSDIMIDQVRAIDNSRLISKIGKLSNNEIEKVIDNLHIMFDFEM